jgi:hypothetical protein
MLIENYKCKLKSSGLVHVEARLYQKKKIPLLNLTRWALVWTGNAEPVGRNILPDRVKNIFHSAICGHKEYVQAWSKQK